MNFPFDVFFLINAVEKRKALYFRCIMVFMCDIMIFHELCKIVLCNIALNLLKIKLKYFSKQKNLFQGKKYNILRLNLQTWILTVYTKLVIPYIKKERSCTLPNLWCTFQHERNCKGFKFPLGIYTYSFNAYL